MTDYFGLPSTNTLIFDIEFFSSLHLSLLVFLNFIVCRKTLLTHHVTYWNILWIGHNCIFRYYVVDDFDDFLMILITYNLGKEFE